MSYYKKILNSQLNELARLSSSAVSGKKKWLTRMLFSVHNTWGQQAHTGSYDILGLSKHWVVNKVLFRDWQQSGSSFSLRCTSKLLPQNWALEAARLQTAVLKLKKRKKKRKNTLMLLPLKKLLQVTQATVRKHKVAKASASKIWSFY